MIQLFNTKDDSFRTPVMNLNTAEKHTPNSKRVPYRRDSQKKGRKGVETCFSFVPLLLLSITVLKESLIIRGNFYVTASKF